MPYARNAVDGRRVYFEDDGGRGAPVVFHGGFLDSVPTVRALDLAEALRDEYRLIFVDHRGLGRSDRPHDPDAYAMSIRVADAVAVLDELEVERAHFIGLSWGGRLGFGIGQHAPHRASSLIIGGNQPYAWPDGPLTRIVTQGLRAARRQGMEALVRAMEEFWDARFSETAREHYLDNDPAALEAAWTEARSEGAISQDLGAWRVLCLIFLGAKDADFVPLAERAAAEIPAAELLLLTEEDHIQTHLRQGDRLVDAVRRTISASDR